jgi:Polyketide cyclase / dehydrase and lipid transport
MAPDIIVTQEIAAPAGTIWNLISDLPRMGEWSPENTGGSWAKGASGPSVGAKFVGTNRNGSKSWKTTCTIVECSAPTTFAFDVAVGPVKVAHWAYRIDDKDGRSLVTESWTDRRGWLATKLGGPASGVADRAAHNRAGMEETLRRLAASLEG